MKKKALLTTALLLVALTNVQAQDDAGFGDEGSGDPALAPAATPINENLTLGLVAGVLIAGYFFLYKRKETI